jgi:lipopolysaccharide transport system permease protein
VGRSTTVILEHGNLVKKVVFPLEIIPLSTTCSALVNHGIALGLFLGGVLVLRGWSLSLLLLPLVFLPLVLLTVGVSLLLASLGVFARDLGQAIGLLLTAWLFLTPILYQQTAVPARFQPFIRANPFTLIVSGYRRTILDGRPPEALGLAQLYAVALLVCVIGFWWFGRTKAVFADVL